MDNDTYFIDLKGFNKILSVENIQQCLTYHSRTTAIVSIVFRRQQREEHWVLVWPEGMSEEQCRVGSGGQPLLYLTLGFVPSWNPFLGPRAEMHPKPS